MMLTLNRIRILIRARPTRRMHRTFDASTFEEAQSKIRNTRLPRSTLELALGIRIVFIWIKDTTAVELIIKLAAILASPTIDTVDFEGRIAEAIITCDVTGRAGDSGS